MIMKCDIRQSTFVYFAVQVIATPQSDLLCCSTASTTGYTAEPFKETCSCSGLNA